MKAEFLDYVEDILDAMEKAEEVVEGVTYQQFATNYRINFVVTRALEIMGEAAKRLPMDVRDKYPQVPWKEMAGARDRIVHGYDVIDLAIVWGIVKRRIPLVRPILKQILIDYEDK
jgi:uncharacterized protein with HEPN domain